MNSKLIKAIANPEKVPPYVLNKITNLINEKFIIPLILPLSTYFGPKFNFGTNVFELDWDLLIILDTARPDSLGIVADEYSFINDNDIDTKFSVGGSSAEWIANTFTHEYFKEIQNTAYITSNPLAETVLENRLELGFTEDSNLQRASRRLKKYGQSNFVEISDLGKYRNFYGNTMSEYGIYPSPRKITDYGIITGRQYDYERIILHYMPPHHPYIADATPRQNGEGNKIEFLSNPRDDYSFDGYLDNLRWGLEEVSILLDNIECDRVIITADHGESFIDLGNAHTVGSPKISVRKVPLVRTQATDRNTYHPSHSNKTNSDQKKKQLEALGYL